MSSNRKRKAGKAYWSKQYNINMVWKRAWDAYKATIIRDLYEPSIIMSYLN